MTRGQGCKPTTGESSETGESGESGETGETGESDGTSETGEQGETRHNSARFIWLVGKDASLQQVNQVKRQVR